MLLASAFIPAAILGIVCFLLLICVRCLIPVGIFLICVFHNRSILYFTVSNPMPFVIYHRVSFIFNSLWISFRLLECEKWIILPPSIKAPAGKIRELLNIFLVLKYKSCLFVYLFIVWCRQKRYQFR